ncbi:MAG: hypothetical protein M3R36_19485 [Bacteroidota bacterium]|nr:hypothetical protein [Bacteroidota bacterium]
MIKIIIIVLILTVNIGLTAEAQTGPADGKSVLLTGFKLFQNYPNPFNDLTIIEFSITDENYVNIFITDKSGNKIETLVEGEVDRGEHYVFFKPRKNMSEGNYYCTMNIFSINEDKIIHSEKIKMQYVNSESIVFKK